MNARRIGIVAVFALLCGSTSNLLAQDNDDAPAITARVHATFVDNTGGAGVLSGDMSIVRFEVRNGTVTAIGRIEGALADSAGNVLGTRVHFDSQAAGFDSRQGTTPKALRVLCAVADVLRAPSTPAARVDALNDVATAVKSKNSR